MARDARRRARSHLRRRTRRAAPRRSDVDIGGAGGGQPTDRPQAPAAPIASIPRCVERARQHYESAMQAQRDGNWALYGEEITLLGELLRGMSK